MLIQTARAVLFGEIRLFWGVSLAAVFQPIGGIDIIIGRAALFGGVIENCR